MTLIRDNVTSIGRAVTLVFLSFSLAGQSLADEERSEAVEQWFNFLGNINASSMMEPAGSHGSIGVSLGAGAATYTVPDNGGRVMSSLLERDEAAEAEPYVVPRLWLLKGLPWPVDVGLTAASDADRLFTQASGFLQWTVYEALARPALSLRGGHGRIFGLDGTELQTNTIDAVASYGFFRYFALYASFGAAQHQATITVRRDDPTGFMLHEDEDRMQQSRAWLTPRAAGGIRVAVLPPFVSMTAEAEQTTHGPRVYAAKLSVGM